MLDLIGPSNFEETVQNKEPVIGVLFAFAMEGFRMHWLPGRASHQRCRFRFDSEESAVEAASKLALVLKTASEAAA